MHAADCEPFVGKNLWLFDSFKPGGGNATARLGNAFSYGAMGYFWVFLRRRARQAPRARRVTVLVTT